MKVIAALLVASCCAFGQWANVTSVTPGRTVTVEKKGGESVKGGFVKATEDSVTILSRQHEISVPRADIVRVEAKRSAHAKWWGLAIGAGGGAAIGGAAGQRAAGNFGDTNVPGWAAGILAVGGALIGLLIGATLDSRHSTIYRV